MRSVSLVLRMSGYWHVGPEYTMRYSQSINKPRGLILDGEECKTSASLPRYCTCIGYVTLQHWGYSNPRHKTVLSQHPQTPWMLHVRH